MARIRMVIERRLLASKVVTDPRCPRMRAFLCVGFRHQHNVLHRPQVGRHATLHRWRGLDGLVNLHEVVHHEVEADRVHVVLKPLAERIGQPSESTVPHAQAQV